MSNDKGKQAAGYKAAELVQNGMKVGLGTGSTAYFFIKRLIERCKEGLNIKAVATSKNSTDQAQSGGIPLIDPLNLDYLDLDVDGADEIDRNKQMIKGGGGALFREKIIARASKQMIVVIDESKLVEKLGGHPLPIELSPYGFQNTTLQLKALALSGKVRMVHDKPYITDNGNYIWDADIREEKRDLRQLDQEIHQVPGVIATGFFWDLAGPVIIGYKEGYAELKDVL
jgi:ribose 5-phosphate isomerase A